MKDLKKETKDGRNCKPVKITSTQIRDFKTDDPDSSYKAIFNIFEIFLTILGFEDDPSFGKSSLRNFSVVGGKIFLFFCSILHLFVVISSIFSNHRTDSIAVVNQFIASISNLFQILVWHQKRKYFRRTLEHLWKKYVSCIYKDLKKLRIFIFIGFTLNSSFFIMVFIFTYKIFDDNPFFIESSFFGLVFNDKIMRRSLTFVVTLIWVWIPLKDCYFALYYSFLCKIFHSIINEFIIKINTEGDVLTLLDTHKNIMEDVSLVENHFSGLLGIVCWVCVFEMFFFEYLIESMKSFFPHMYMLIIWYAAMLLCLLLNASLVNESLDNLKDCINQRCALDSSIQNIRFVQKVYFTNTKLTIWKILDIKRITIFSILGTYVTYSYLIIS